VVVRFVDLQLNTGSQFKELNYVDRAGMDGGMHLNRRISLLLITPRSKYYAILLLGAVYYVPSFSAAPRNFHFPPVSGPELWVSRLSSKSRQVS
jgi:hypothetical protein